MSTSNLNPGLLQQNRGPVVYAVVIVGYLLAVIAVVLRLVTRKNTKTRFWWDDFFIIVSLVRPTTYLTGNGQN